VLRTPFVPSQQTGGGNVEGLGAGTTEIYSLAEREPFVVPRHALIRARYWPQTTL
jgi:hypothetical protein